MDAEIYGWSCLVTYRPYGSEALAVKEIHRRGKSPGCVTGAARRMNGYVRCEQLTPYTLAEWKRMFGECTETGRYYTG